MDFSADGQPGKENCFSYFQIDLDNFFIADGAAEENFSAAFFFSVLLDYRASIEKVAILFNIIQ